MSSSAEYQREWRRREPELYAAGKRRYQQGTGRVYQRKRTLASYGLTPEEYEQLLAKQDGRCAICTDLPSGNGRNAQRLQVDHDHETGVVRGLLCNKCNRGIGLMRDSYTMLETAATYLRKALSI